MEHPVPALPTGVVVNGYRILATLGSGSFGITYLARGKDQRIVALKEWAPPIAAQREADAIRIRTVTYSSDGTFGRASQGTSLDDFVHEASLTRSIAHPNIVRIHDTFEANGTGYMVMDHLPGGSLVDRLRTLTELPTNQFVEGLHDGLVAALTALHERGIVHGDVRPANVLLTTDDAPVLVDFSLAGRREDGWQPKVDIHGLAATLYRTITGQPAPTVEIRPLMSPLVPVSFRLRRWFDPKLLRVIDTTLNSEPAELPDSMAEWPNWAMSEPWSTSQTFVGDRDIRPGYRLEPEPHGTIIGRSLATAAFDIFAGSTMSPRHPIAAQASPSPPVPMPPPDPFEVGRPEISAPTETSAIAPRAVVPAFDLEGPDGAGDVVTSVFAPDRLVAGHSAMVQVFLHLQDQSTDAAALAREFDADAMRRGARALAMTIPSGTSVQIGLTLPGLVVEPAIDSLVWNRRPESVQFSVSAPLDRQPGNIVGTTRVFVDGAPIGELRFKMSVVAGGAATPRSAQVEARRYRLAFASYASEDRAEVLRRVQTLRRVGIQVFQDVLDLEPGQRWERELYRHIDECDVMLLFWSNAARKSEWVAREIDYALARQQRERVWDDDPDRLAIEPVPIEGPPIPAPPDQLKHLHFNDALLYAIAGEDRARGR